jgi:ATP-dependent DNA helicase RecG
MTIDELRERLSVGETDQLEFKKSTAQLRPACETLCAFLNGLGGMVMMGVSNEGKLLGQDVTDNTKQEIARELAKIEPHAAVVIEYLPFEGRFIICLSVTSSTHKPHVYDGRAFQRSQTVTERMSQHRYEQLLVERGQLNHSWEEFESTHYTIDDLDHEEIRKAVFQGVSAGRVPAQELNASIEKILHNWRLIENSKLNHAAVVLFAKDVMPRYSQCHIKLGRFVGTDIFNGFIDNQNFLAMSLKCSLKRSTLLDDISPSPAFLKPIVLSASTNPLYLC